MVNLAAGTQTSDLRNDYGAVRATVLPAGSLLPQVIPSFCQVSGSIHERSGMRSLFTTATTVRKIAYTLLQMDA